MIDDDYEPKFHVPCGSPPATKPQAPQAPQALTGDEVCRIRKHLYLEPREFAQLLGVAQSTVYRWEQCGAGTVRIEPQQDRILTVAAGLVARKNRDIGHDVRRALALRGGLYGLYVLLRYFYE